MWRGLDSRGSKVIEEPQAPTGWVRKPADDKKRNVKSAIEGRGNELPMIESDWPNLPAMFFHWAARKTNKPFLWVRKDKEDRKSVV